MKKLKPAPSFHCRDMQKAVDNICEYTFDNPTQQRSVRIYFYRTRLFMPPNQVAAIFNLDPYFINCIASKIGRNKSEKIERIECALKNQFPKYHINRYKKHVQKIVNRI